jgi:hypothetical protein
MNLQYRLVFVALFFMSACGGASSVPATTTTMFASTTTAAVVAEVFNPYEEQLWQLCDNKDDVFASMEDLITGTSSGNTGCKRNGKQIWFFTIKDSYDLSSEIEVQLSIDDSQWSYKKFVCGPQYLISVKSEFEQNDIVGELLAASVPASDECS